MKSKVVVRSVKDHSIKDALLDIFDRLDWTSLVKPGSSVVIKLNLCEFDAAKVSNANTSPEVIRAVCQILKGRTSDITLVEAHSYRAPAEIAFENTGIYKLAEEVSVKVVNLSKSPCREIGHNLLGPMPELLLNADVFMSLPKLKTHALTYFTGTLKNQWGCVPRHDRIALHHSLDQLLVDLNKILRPSLSIMDATVCMEGRGPTNGKPRRLDVLLGSRDPVALDGTAMRLVGLNPSEAHHLVMAYEQGQGSFTENEIAIDMDFERDWADFEPARMDWAVAWMNYLTRYSWFREHLLSVNWIFYPTKKLVNFLRTIGIVR